MKSLGMFVTGILIGCFYVLVSWRLWGWFAVPLGAPVIGYWQAFGLYCIAASVMVRGIRAKRHDAEDSAEDLVVVGQSKMLVAAPLLGEGWIVHAFIIGAA